MKKFTLAALVAVPLLITSCKVADLATPQEQAQIEAIEIALDAAEAAIEEAVEGVQDATEALTEAAKNGDVAGMQAAQADLEERALEIELMEQTWQEQAQRLADLDRAIIEREISPWLAAISGFIPAPVQPFIPVLMPLVGLAFDRPRKHAGKALRSVLRGSLAEAGLALARALGYAHSSPETARVAAQEELNEKQQKLDA